MTFLNKIKLLIRKILNLKENWIFYINGPETLPPPLSLEDEAEAIANIKTNSESKNLLIEHNLRLVVYISKKFENTGVGIEDLVSIGTIGLIKAVNTFNIEKNIKLATYASRCIENEILMYIRKTGNSRTDISIDEPINVDWDGNELLLSDVLSVDTDSVNKNIEEREEKRLILKAISSLSAREEEIVRLRFGLTPDGKEKTQKEIADKLGISQSYISRIEKKIMERLKIMLGDLI